MSLSIKKIVGLMTRSGKHLYQYCIVYNVKISLTIKINTVKRKDRVEVLNCVSGVSYKKRWVDDV